MGRILAAMMFALFCVTGCSDKEEPKDHVWKSQQRAIEKAKDAERQIQEAFERRKKQAGD